MNEERIKEVFSDEAFVKELFSKETPEEVQAMLEDKDIELSIDEIVKLKELLEKKVENPDAELSDEDLEDVAGGCLLGACLAAGLMIVGAWALTGLVSGAAVTHENTNGRW